MSATFGNLNLYEELEITKEATPEDIKKSYKKLAMKWHPDKNKDPGATEKFQKISHAYSILSDPTKKERYDKYGSVDDDDFNFEEFMKGFNFQDIFTDLFNNDMFGKFMTPISAFEGRHAIKIMYIRKKALNIQFQKDLNNEAFDELPMFMHGIGRGMKPTHNLIIPKPEEVEDEWTTDDEMDGNEKAEENEDGEEEIEEEEIDDESILEVFITENSKQQDGDLFSCKYCPSQEPLDKKALHQHFIDTHKKEFIEYFGEDVSWDEAVSNSKKKTKKKKQTNKNMFGEGFEEMFGGMGGMPGGFFMGAPGFFPMDIGQMFGMNEKETEQMMKDFEKMFPGAHNQGEKKKKKK